MLRASRSTTSILLLMVLLLGAVVTLGGGPRVVNIVADRDNRFRVPGQKEAVITVKANEVILLRITARRATEWEKDGTVHGFTITALKDRGWNLRLKEGTQEFPMVAPAEPGEYVVECAVKCGKGHDDMRMKIRVVP